LRKAIEELSDNPVCCVRVLGALVPDLIREKIKDGLAEWGVTEEDLRQLLREREHRQSPSSQKH
jgi:hypothetical protein